MEVDVRFIAPVSLTPGSEGLRVEVPEGGTIGDVVNELERRKGARFRRMICEADGRPYVVFLVRGTAVSIDHALQAGDTVWILPPVYGG